MYDYIVFMVQVRSGPAYFGPAQFGPTLSDPADLALHKSARKQSGPLKIGPVNNPAFKQSSPAQFNPGFL
jgi:hypothetical protein